jgi:hypothetical protein
MFLTDLIAMNALYRPGPLEYIPSFVKTRKNGQRIEIKYDLPDYERIFRRNIWNYCLSRASYASYLKNWQIFLKVKLIY